MASPNSSFIDPSSLSLLSSSSTPDPGSPSDSYTAGPPRKRARTESTPEDRKEARAHRNRIAAQNSRDRRKAHFTYLERRVAELEEENRQLRVGTSGAGHRRSEERPAEDLERERARDRENEELRERVKVLEKGWDTVVKALAAQGLPTGTQTPPTSSVTPPETDTASSSPQPQPPTIFPVLVPTPPIFPVSPALSHSSLSSSNLFSEEFEFESTRHLARVATTEAPPPSVSLQRLSFDLDLSPETCHTAPGPMSPAVDDTTMEDLFREILAPSPSLSTTSLPLDPHAILQQITSPSSVAPSAPAVTSGETPVPVDWVSEAEMQKILSMLPGFRSDAVDVDVPDYPSALDLELGGGWEFENMSGSLTGIGVF